MSKGDELRDQHRQVHNGQYVVCRRDGNVWPCIAVRPFMVKIERLSEDCQFICPDCCELVWMQVQSGEMWCPNGHCDWYNSQFALIGLLFDPDRLDVHAELVGLRA